MNSTYKVAGISAVVALIIGFCIGFFPEHAKVESQQAQILQLGQGQSGALTQVGQAQELMALSNFTIEAAAVSKDAEENNFSVASNGASTLFGGLRTYVDHSGDPALNQQLSEVLGNRDRVIAGLAQANPAVKPVLGEIFAKLQAIRAQRIKVIG